MELQGSVGTDDGRKRHWKQKALPDQCRASVIYSCSNVSGATIHMLDKCLY